MHKVLLAAADSAGLAVLKPAADLLGGFGVMWSQAEMHAEGTDLADNGLCAFVVASPDAALPATIAGKTKLPVIRVPLASAGEESLVTLRARETGDLPAAADGEEPFATVAIGEAGAKNAALLIVSVLALRDADLALRWAEFRAQQTDTVIQHPPLEAL